MALFITGQLCLYNHRILNDRGKILHLFSICSMPSVKSVSPMIFCFFLIGRIFCYVRMRVLVCVLMKVTEEDAEFFIVRVTRHCETPNIDVRSQSLVL